MKSIVLGGGCFWCVEAVYQQVKGVVSVTSGYGGGSTENPTYDDIGNHAEVVKIEYDEAQLSLDTILEIFFSIHDPTTLNRQGNDVGEQYRSIIICEENEIDTVRKARDKAQDNWSSPIVTEIKLHSPYFKAEDYHQNYFKTHPEAGYCQIIINPKLEKFRKNFHTLLSS